MLFFASMESQAVEIIGFLASWDDAVGKPALAFKESRLESMSGVGICPKVLAILLRLNGFVIDTI
jgi:hypothetical protein